MEKLNLGEKLSSFIVPCYNEEQVLPIFRDSLCAQLSELGVENYEIIFVEDGSKDGTLELLKEFAANDARVKYISLSRNFGKEGAMLAGLRAAKGDYIAIMDADMQDPPSLLPQMYEAILRENFDCAACKRADRSGESFVKKFLIKSFYKTINAISQVKLVADARDFRLMTRPVADAILSMPENTRFTKGIYEWVGFKTKWISFSSVRRAAGTSKWSLLKLFLYALDGISAFSTVPLALATLLGLALFLVSILGTLVILIHSIAGGGGLGAGFALCILSFIGALQLICMGIIGHYVAKIYAESTRRPLYIIRESNIEALNGSSTKA